MSEIRTQCAIAGGGPAGMMVGFLLARAGVDVVVLEKQGDFLRDFRGDTIHPSTFELMYELGLLPEFLRLPHHELTEVAAEIGRFHVPIADFSHLPTHCKFAGLMPQWDFLNFLADKGRAYSGFHLRMNCEAVDLIHENGSIAGVCCTSPDGSLDVRAPLTVGADGRHSIVRRKAGFEVIDLGAPIDVLWMRLSRHPDDPARALGHVQPGRFLVTLNRGDYWQCGYVIPKGAADEIRNEGLPAFREDIAKVAPFLRDRVAELQNWDPIKLLTVRVDRLRRWSRPGLLCIGDSAHAMSPVGGVGINLASQDAVAAANILAGPLKRNEPTDPLLPAIQHRREFPTRMTQRLQIIAHHRILSPTLNRKIDLRRLPLPLRLVQRFPALRRIPARIIGLGFRPEHIHTATIL